MSSEQIICVRCPMDKSAREIVFDEYGVCNFCHQADKALTEIRAEEKNLSKRIEEIRADRKQYDCIIGLSGGVDSSTVLVAAKRLGLEPLCFSMDNGYNDPKADENIMNLVEGLEVTFYRYVLDLDKYKELQSAYLKAGVINVEASYDHLLMAATYEMASLYGIKWIFSGGNVATESIMPPSWGHSARDLWNLKDIYRWATGKKLTGLPLCGLLKWNWYRWVKGIKVFYLLDYLDYNRTKAEQLLVKEHRFQSTGEKHEENIFTRWYQSFYLFEKWGIDKRKAHYSSLVASGQMTRSEAMLKLTENPVYPQLGIEDKVMKYPKHSHSDFRSDVWLYNMIGKVVKWLS